MLPYNPVLIYKYEGEDIPTMSKWLRFAIRTTGIVQADLARRMNVSSNNLSMWINGRQKMPAKHFMKLAKIFNVDPLYLRNIVNYDYFRDEECFKFDEQIRQLGTLTVNELEFIKLIRKHGGNPKLETNDQKKMFDLFLKTLEPDTPTAENIQERKRAQSLTEAYRASEAYDATIDERKISK